jgi:hypothetical protein
MKIKILSTLLFATVLLCGCSSTNFTEYRGPAVVQGNGGTVRVVDGIDFWENGNPDRKFKILGVIDDSRRDGIFTGSGRDSAIAKVARERGGDAVILVDSDRELSGVDQYGDVHYRRNTKLMVVKYVE